MTVLILALLIAFGLTFFFLPHIIKIAHQKQLCDVPNERTSHTETTPSLGGIGIFAGVIFALVLCTPYAYFPNLQYILLAFFIILFIGAKDDISPISPSKKLAGQLCAAGALVLKANLLIPSFYGMFGLYELSYGFSIALSIFTIIVIINAFNLIDGINGLSASVAILISLIFGTYFYYIGQLEYAVLGFATMGSLLAFLKYNITPAKIFMGDTGSLFIGLISSILTIKFLMTQNDPVLQAAYPELVIQAVPVVAIGILILPLFDTLRVFIMRILRGRSPMSPDRNHIHHLLIDYGFSHMQATGVLVAVNTLFIAFVYYFNNIGSWILLATILFVATLMTALLKVAVRKKLKAGTKAAIGG